MPRTFRETFFSHSFASSASPRRCQDQLDLHAARLLSLPPSHDARCPSRARLQNTDGNGRRVQDFAVTRILSRLEVALELTPEDQESLKAVRRLQEILRGVVSPGDSSSGDGRSRSPVSFPPLGLLSPFLGGAVGRGDGSGSSLGAREAVDTARQAAAIVSLIGPGLLSIAQKFLVQLSVR